MLYQIINENLVRQFPNFIERGGMVYTNESAEQRAKKSGEWYELVTTPQPEYDPETQYLARTYRQEDDAIYLDWVVKQRTLVGSGVENG